METNFGRSTPYSLGIEEEYQVLDGLSCELASRAESILSSFAGEVIEPRIKPELLQSMIEVSTRVAGSVAEAVDDLIDLRQRVSSVAAEHDLLIASAGTHPFSRCDDQQVTQRPRYQRLARRLRPLVTRQPAFGLHIHVGVSSGEKAIACADGIRRFLPELLALSANSPFWQAQPSGFASTRAAVLASLPRSGIPPTLELDGRVRGARRARRPHRQLPRLHLPLVGRPPAPRARDDRDPGVRHADADREHGRDRGPGAVPRRDPRLRLRVWRDAPGSGPAPARRKQVACRTRRPGSEAASTSETEVARPAVEAIRLLVERCGPAAEALGCADELELVEGILRSGNGAADQLRVYRETNSLRDVAETVARETARVSVAAGPR